MASTIRLRRGTALEWSTTNPVLAEGEEGLELGSMRRKIGDGYTRWNLLPYNDRAAATAGGFAGLLGWLPDPDSVFPLAASQGVTLAHNATAPTGTVTAAEVSPVAVRGGLWTLEGTGLRNTINDPHPTIPSPVLEFDWTAGVAAVLGVRLTNPTATSHGVRVWVNGVPIAAAFTAVAVAAGAYSYAKLTATSAGTYRVRVEVALARFAGLVYTLGASAPAPAQHGPRVAVLGDSWAEGALGVAEPDLWPNQLAQLLGTPVARSGQGSSGYIAAVLEWGARPYGDPTRIARLVSYAPDLLVIQGSQNDDNAGNAAIRDAAAAVYRTLAGALPDCPVLVVGPPRVGGDPSSARIANRDGVRDAATAATNVVGFLDQIGGPGGPWFTGTGKAGATTGDGNSDLLVGTDGAHPTALGHAYLARRIHAGIRELLGAR